MPINGTTNITSPTLDQGQNNPTFNRNQSRLKFEVLSYNPFEVPVKKPSLLSRMLSAAGGFAPLAIVAAPFTGGTSLIAGAALAGAGAIGNKAKQNNIAEQQQALQGGPQAMTYPGLSPTAGGISPTAFSSDPLLDVVSSAREGTARAAIETIK